jgi:hypothetical protein
MTDAQLAALVAQVARVTPRVHWAHQTRERPPRPFIELAIVDSTAIGPEDVTLDNPTPSPGAELIYATVDHVDYTLQARVYSAAVVGSTSAFSIANALQGQLTLTSMFEALGATGIALTTRGQVQQVNAPWETEYEGVAVLNFGTRVKRINIGPAPETGTYIQTAEIEGTLSNVTSTTIVG